MKQFQKTSLILHKRETKLQRWLELWQLKLRNFQNARLIAGLLFFVSLVPASLKAEAGVEFLWTLPFLIVFLVFVAVTKNYHRHVQNLQGLLAFTRRQKNRVHGIPSGRSWKQAEEASRALPMVRDLGLVGSHSLWTLLDETLSEGGQKKLLEWMSVKPLDKNLLSARQETLKKLRPQSWFYTRLCLQANSNELNLSTLQLQDFLKKSFVDTKFFRIFVVSLCLWVLTASLMTFSISTGTKLPSVLFLAFPLFSLWSLGSVGTAFLSGVGLSHHLGTLVPLFTAIEKRSAYDHGLKEICGHIAAHRPSRAAKKLDFILGFVGTQTNPILRLFVNVLSPWTLTSVFFLEKARRKMAEEFPASLEELAELEVWGSLLIFDKYQTQMYPEFANTGSLQCSQVFHPLLERSRAVANDFSFPTGKTLGLLTGSNMSGKSTFLRTLGINQVLANMGAPVFADKFLTVPARIETCIEVSDSLRDGYSYFYAEVRRLKDILQTAATKTPVLFLIDEIFRGTNNRERQIGSKAVIRALAQEKTALGFISTHDLELTSLEEDHPSLMNLHFREDIDTNGKMVFYYHLKHGPCPTTNALRIMEAEGIKI
ncbi:MutS family DNA mismatch repair protein [Bdellovibrio sp. HCB337]|uniref:MutS family DNA mismatch repair protein n=1 Tax=Bdellovibrio sp. HCB337 TaxID=3394358 RepID=UPI0039A75C5D